MVSIGIILLMLILSGFFSGMEIAFVSANKLQLELDKESESFTGKLLKLFSNSPEKYITTMLVGNNIALVVYGIVIANLLGLVLEKFDLSDSAILLIQTIISTLIILFLAEFFPKTIFRINPNQALKRLSYPVAFFWFIFSPISNFSIWISRVFLKLLFKTDIQEKNDMVFGRLELADFVNLDEKAQQEKQVEENEVKLFQKALDFSKVKLRECMVPRTEIEALEDNTTLEDLQNRFIETGFTKILIYKENIDNIIGYVHSSEIFSNPDAVESRIRKVTFVPESMPANKLLSQFINQHKSIAIVVDEFGGTAGMVTTEDILEEIFGEIVDEHDTVDLIERQLSETEFLLSARSEIDLLNEKFNLDFPVEENYETLAGFILFHHRSIPKLHSEIEIGKYQFRILKGSQTRIELVRLTVIEK